MSYLEDKLAQEILILYKAQYEQLIPGFQEIYEAFDCVAGSIGDVATTALVHNALGTFQREHSAIVNPLSVAPDDVS